MPESAESSHVPGEDPVPSSVDRALHSFFRPGVKEPLQPIEQLRPGRVVGDFRLVELIAQGGMGQVWKAEQLSLGNRHVAIKFIRPERVTERQLAWFDREARAGGRLSHPGIVAVHGHGESEGMAWIAMEFVEGAWTLRDFLDEISREPELPGDYDRHVARFICEVATAMHAAHEGGVIHRDLKPQNILITTDNRPKVTDFGLARITDESALSQSGDAPGTLHYMSPEQVAASRARIDHRTDVFSLGVILYEMLALQRPFQGDTSHQVAFQITAKDPADLRSIRSRIPRDLVVITNKALEKERDRRYSTMAELAADLNRFLTDEPILAKPPTAVQRARKWVRRNPTRSTAAAIMVVALGVISGLLVKYVDKSEALAEANTSLEGRTKELAEANANLEARTEELGQRNEELTQAQADVEKQRDQITVQRNRLEKVVEFQQGLFENLDPDSFGARLRRGARDELATTLEGWGQTDEEVATALEEFQRATAPINFTDLGVNAIAGEILDPARKHALGDFVEDPLTGATLQEAAAMAYRELGVYAPALALMEMSLKSRRFLLGADDPDTLTSVCRMGLLLESMGKLDSALPYYQEALEGRRQVLGDLHPQTLVSVGNMGCLLESKGRRDEALPYFREALEGKRQTLGDLNPSTIRSVINMGSLLDSMGKPNEAMPYCEEAVEKCRQVLGDLHPLTFASLNNMGSLLESVGKPDEGLPYCREAVEGCRQVLGDLHPYTLACVSSLSGLLRSMGNLGEALPYCKEVLEGRRKILGDLHPDTLTTLNNMGGLLKSMNKLDEAQPYYQEALEGRRKTLGDLHPDTLTTVNNMGGLLKAMNKLDEARSYYQEALEGCRKVLGNDHPKTLSSVKNMGSLLKSMGKLEEALPYYREALEGRRQVLGNLHPITLESASDLGGLLVSMGKPDEALPCYQEALEGYRKALGALHPGTLICTYNTGLLLQFLDRPQEARTLLEPALDQARSVRPLSDQIRKALTRTLADCYEALHEQDPTAGFDTKAAELRKELEDQGEEKK